MITQKNKALAPTYFRTININSNVLIPDSYIDFTESILALNRGTERIEWWTHCLPLQVPDDRLSDSYADVYELSALMLSILQVIPVYLMATPPIIGDLYAHAKGDVLGIYASGKITLFPETIWSSVKNESEFMLLTAKVLIHELAHAVMDPNIFSGHTDRFSNEYRNYTYQSWRQYRFVGQMTTDGYCLEPVSFYHVREESYANVITYRVFALAYNMGIVPEKNLDYVERFISHQADAYRLSLEILPSDGIKAWIELKEKTLLQREVADSWMDLTGKLKLKRKVNRSFLCDEIKEQYPWAQSQTGELLINNIPAIPVIQPLWKNGGKSSARLINQFGDSITGRYDEILSGFENIYPAKQQGSWFLLDGNGKRILEKRFQEVLIAGKNSSKTILVKQYDKWFVVDKTGSIFNELPYQVIEYLKETDSRLKFRLNNRYGIIDSDLSEIVPADYEHISAENDGSYFKAERNNKIFLFTINARGAHYLEIDGNPIAFDSIGFDNSVGLMVGYSGPKRFLFNRNLDVLMNKNGKNPADVEDYRKANRGIAYKENGLWGLASKNLKVLLPPNYVSLDSDPRSELYYKIQSIDRKWGLVKKDSGEFQLPCEYDSVDFLNYKIIGGVRAEYWIIVRDGEKKRYNVTWKSES